MIIVIQTASSLPQCFRLAKPGRAHDLPCLHLKIDDQQPISRRDLKLAFGFLEDRTAVGHRVLVHCWAGVSRSSAIVAAFVGMTAALSLEDALKIIHEKRPKADPVPVVWQSIREAEVRFS
jgi:histidinol-phosphate aminotransferase